MKILVPIKRVVDPWARPNPTPDGKGVDVTGLKFEINPFDEIALEEAVRLREGGADVQILLVSIGGPECEEQLRKALAMGGDRAILLETDAPLDARAVSHALAELANAEAVDMILMGKQATDGDGNQVPQRLAARLGWPQATFASKVTLTGGGVEVVRETDDGQETLTLSLPAVVSADLRLNEPRYVSLPGIIKARSKPLERRPAGTLPASALTTTAVRKPPARAAGRKVGSTDELFDAIVGAGAL